jgi:hypothetical protein
MAKINEALAKKLAANAGALEVLKGSPLNPRAINVTLKFGAEFDLTKAQLGEVKPVDIVGTADGHSYLVLADAKGAVGFLVLR